MGHLPDRKTDIDFHIKAFRKRMEEKDLAVGVEEQTSCHAELKVVGKDGRRFPPIFLDVRDGKTAVIDPVDI
jgi:hypothetical protein